MALETLKGVKEIGGFRTIHLDEAKKDSSFYTDGQFDWNKFDEYRKGFPIGIADSVNMLSFKIQNGPIKENGVNGCQVDTLIHAAIKIISGLNENFPASHNVKAIGHLQLAIAALQKRKEDREKRGVEGYNKQ